jgi:hypothetical protein
MQVRTGWPLSTVDVEDWTADQLQALASSARAPDRERTRALAAILRYRLDEERGLSPLREVGIQERLAVLERAAGDLLLTPEVLPVIARAVHVDPGPPARSVASRKGRPRAALANHSAVSQGRPARAARSPSGLTPRERASQAAAREFAERTSAALRAGGALGQDVRLGIQIPARPPDVDATAEQVLRYARRRAAPR